MVAQVANENHAFAEVEGIACNSDGFSSDWKFHVISFSRFHLIHAFEIRIAGWGHY